MAPKDTKLWQKTKDMGKKFTEKAKQKTTEQIEKLKRKKSILEDFHLTKGEFVVNKDFRQVLSFGALILVIALLLLSVGELIFSFIAYLNLSNYSLFLKDFGTFKLIKYMVISFVVITIFGLFFLWVIDSYRTAEEELLVSQIKRCHIYIKISFYSSFALTIALIVLMVYSSNYFHHLYKILTQKLSSSVSNYLENLETKELVDKLQWKYDCCGAQSHTDWFQTQIQSNKNSVQTNNRSVPFSCCRKDVSECKFSSIDEDLQTIYANKGCRNQVFESLNGLKTGVQWYRLTEMFILFCYIVLVDIIQHSLQSEYDAGAHPPVAKFPTFYVVIELIIFVTLYFSTFLSHS